MNPAAAAIASQIKSGTVLKSLRPFANGELVTVGYIKGKTVFFTNGKNTGMRSLFHYEIAA